MSILVLVDHKNGKVGKPALATLRFAKELSDKTGEPFHLVVSGSGVSAVADELKGFGAASIMVADKPELANFVAEYCTDVVYTAAKEVDANFIVGVANSSGKAVLPRVAARLDAGMVSDIVGWDADAMTFKRPVYAGNIIVDVEVSTPIKVISVRGTAFEPLEPQGGESEIKSIEPQFSDVTSKVKFIALHESKSERPELTDAPVVVSGGRGIKSREDFEALIYPLADLLGAAVGATRAIVDAGIMSNDYQVGQTGKIVAPDLYIAIGISGAIQHLAGMKDSKVIVAINKDEEAPIFNVADYGLVEDLYKAVPALTEKIQQVKK